MGFFPSLRQGSDRWWLPCGDLCQDVIGQLLVRHAQCRPADAVARASLADALQTDPPLLIYASLRSAFEQASIDQLADWWLEHGPSLFADGDAFLGAPTHTPALQLEIRKLRDYFRTIPVEEWMDRADLWLQLTGPTPSETWKARWPVIELDDDGLKTADSHATDCEPNLLQQLALLGQRHRQLEQAFDQQVHHRKLAALKQLAYGLSHEINNPLANISTRAQQLQRGESDPARTATLQRIVDQVYRAHEMIADLMFYANPPNEDVASCQIVALLQQVAESFEEELERQSIRLELSALSGDISAVVDGEMIGEAIRVLIRNAIDAIGCQGTIVVSLVPDENQLLIHVADSGPGLSDEARTHAFDPYYSGREAGRGLGLGLCRAYRIAKLHGGDVRLASGPAGCVATIALPVLSD